MAITETDSIHEDTMGFLFDCTGTLMQEGEYNIYIQRISWKV